MGDSLGRRLDHAPGLVDAPLDDLGRRGPAGGHALGDVGPVGRHPARIGRQAGQQLLEALGRVGALEASQLAHQRLGPVELVERLHLPQAQLVGAAEALDDGAHQPQRDRVLDRQLDPSQLARPRSSQRVDHGHEGGSARG